MLEFHHRYRWLCTLVAAVFVLTVIPLPAAKAKMISTQALAAGTTADEARARIEAMLERHEVHAQLIALGVDPQIAHDRVAALSDNEARSLAKHIDSMPAGGDALGLIVGVGLVVFLVLLVTDILGFTDVFPFVKKTAR
jgi:hypothetical protein